MKLRFFEENSQAGFLGVVLGHMSLVSKSPGPWASDGTVRQERAWRGKGILEQNWPRGNSVVLKNEKLKTWLHENVPNTNGADSHF